MGHLPITISPANHLRSSSTQDSKADFVFKEAKYQLVMPLPLLLCQTRDRILYSSIPPTSRRPFQPSIPNQRLKSLKPIFLPWSLSTIHSDNPRKTPFIAIPKINLYSSKNSTHFLLTQTTSPEISGIAKMVASMLQAVAREDLAVMPDWV